MKKRKFVRLLIGALGVAPILVALSKRNHDDVVLTHNGVSLRLSGDISKIRLGRQPDGIVYVVAPRGAKVTHEES